MGRAARTLLYWFKASCTLPSSFKLVASTCSAETESTGSTEGTAGDSADDRLAILYSDPQEGREGKGE